MNENSQQTQTKRFNAMGCQIQVWLEVDAPDKAVKPLAETELIFRQIEERLSRFRPESELSQLNRHSGQWIELSAELWNAVQTALIFAEETDGAFDPTILAAIHEAGYSHSFDTMKAENASDQLADKVPTPGPLSNVDALIDTQGRWSDIRSDPAAQAIWLPDGVGLDLGGIAKGWTAQLVVNHLRPYGPCLVDAAGDLTAGDAPAGYPGWSVAIAKPGHQEPDHPSDKQEDLARLWLNNATLATSGIDYRRWRANGRVAHHIIDPATGEPAATDLLTVSLLDENACRAEAWATAAMVAGRQNGFRNLSRREFPALLTSYSKSGSQCEASQKIEAVATPALNRLYQSKAVSFMRHP